VFDQHTDSAGPAVRATREISLLLIEDFAGLSIMHVPPDFAMAALRAGALGYVTKSSPPDVLLRAIAAR
jgi:DNA-binding NarL/FixJ family response regulator